MQARMKWHCNECRALWYSAANTLAAAILIVLAALTIP